MKRILWAASGAVWLAIGLAACEPDAPPTAAVGDTGESSAFPESENVGDLVREALTNALRDEDAYARARRLGALLPTLGPESVPTVVEILSNRMLDLEASELELLVRYWATHQPEAAANWSKQRSPTDYRPSAVAAALMAWAEADPQAAVDAAWPWATEPTLERIVPSALVRGWFAAGDPPELTQWIRDLPVGISRQRAIAAYIRVVIQRRGADAVTQWAESLPDDDAAYKLTVFRRVIDALSRLDIGAGLRWCDTQCDGPYGNNMRSLIARNWVLDDGPAALAWLSTAPEGRERDFAVRLTFAAWERADREAALAWMASQTDREPEPWVRTLYPLYAKSLAEDSPEEAMGWAERIENAAERETILIKVARVWRYLDEAAAADWLQQSPLSEEAREQVRAPLDVDPS